jgi:hypothetical protein
MVTIGMGKQVQSTGYDTGTEPAMQLLLVQMRVKFLTSTMSQGMKRNQKILLYLPLWRLRALI